MMSIVGQWGGIASTMSEATNPIAGMMIRFPSPEAICQQPTNCGAREAA
jgi:hypothetical protein